MRTSAHPSTYRARTRCAASAARDQHCCVAPSSEQRPLPRPAPPPLGLRGLCGGGTSFPVSFFSHEHRRPKHEDRCPLRGGRLGTRPCASRPAVLAGSSVCSVLCGCAVSRCFASSGWIRRFPAFVRENPPACAGTLTQAYPEQAYVGSSANLPMGIVLNFAARTCKPEGRTGQPPLGWLP